MSQQATRERRNKELVLEGLEIFNVASKAFTDLGLSADGQEFHNGGKYGGEMPAGMSELFSDFLGTLSDDVLWTSMNGNLLRGKEAVATDVFDTFKTFPGIRISLPVDSLVTQSDEVIVRYDMTGNQLRGFMGLPPITRPFSISLAISNRFDGDGRRTQAIGLWNPLELYFNLGFPRFPILGGARAHEVPTDGGNGRGEDRFDTSLGDWKWLLDVAMGSVRLPIQMLMRALKPIISDDHFVSDGRGSSRRQIAREQQAPRSAGIKAPASGIPVAILRDENQLPFFEYIEGFSFQLLQADIDRGFWVARALIEPGVTFPTHKHTGEVFAFTIAGSWYYLEYPEVNIPGSYLFEPAGSIHTLHAPETNDVVTDVLFLINGALLNLNERGEVEEVLDAGAIIDFYQTRCRESGLGHCKIIDPCAATEHGNA